MAAAKDKGAGPVEGVGDSGEPGLGRCDQAQGEEQGEKEREQDKTEAFSMSHIDLCLARVGRLAAVGRSTRTTVG